MNHLFNILLKSKPIYNEKNQISNRLGLEKGKESKESIRVENKSTNCKDINFLEPVEEVKSQDK